MEMSAKGFPRLLKWSYFSLEGVRNPVVVDESICFVLFRNRFGDDLNHRLPSYICRYVSQCPRNSD